MSLAPYLGPSVFGYETDALRRVASISIHTSPLASLGGRDAGGMNVYIRELSCHTAQRGLPVDIFTRRSDPQTPETQDICDGVNVVTLNAGPPCPIDKNDLFRYLPRFAEEAALYSLREGVRYDVVHAHYWLSGWTAHLLRRYWDAPFVQMFHTTAHMKNAVSGATHRETQLRQQIEGLLTERADSIIAANPDERAGLIWRQRAAANKICTIPPGVDTELFQPVDGIEARAQLGLPNGVPIVLFVGRIDPIKGIDTLLEAAALMAPDFPVLFTFVGGDLDSTGQPVGALTEVIAEAERLGIGERCRFLGSQPQNSLPLFYAAADVVAVPSRYESFGLVAVEAMACGKPVVASSAGGLTFTVADGDSGFLVPVDDAEALAATLSRLVADPELAVRMGAHGREIAERFSWPAVAAAVQHVYHRLADGHRRNLCCEEEIYA